MRPRGRFPVPGPLLSNSNFLGGPKLPNRTSLVRFVMCPPETDPNAVIESGTSLSISSGGRETFR